MCNQHVHYSPHPEIVQLMPVQKDLYAVYDSSSADAFSIESENNNLKLIPVLFMALIRHGDKTMVEGFYAADAIQSCEDVDGFKGYAVSLAEAERRYADGPCPVK